MAVHDVEPQTFKCSLKPPGMEGGYCSTIDALRA